ncbi:Oxysterol-binding protein-domain-containing protein [Apodospora peruviana]|uniref:Oxysterol-binding protein-domain-containing protein n=1 Tax=Apodospora peruviana TaxID=516989 RepID=A0AAE0IHN9_9PEZI|nr:Oxysterol-binding protein-domain-containing protein [Apodospora peruviana]
MAGIEQLEIHSKSYIVRWVKVEEGHTISWSVQPHKKSINFAIVKHPGTGGTSLASQADERSSSEHRTTEAGSVDGSGKPSLFARKDASTAQDQLAKKGFIPIKWHGKCEADKVSMGTYDVTSGGMFGLVFDNTFSKQTSKTATFVLLTYPTGAPPQTAHHLPNLQQSGPNASSSRTSLGKHSSPRIMGHVGSESVDSLHSHRGGRANSIAAKSEAGSSSYHTGTLLKRRRKKGQGYARRFFSLDYTTCTLSYYHNRNSSALRGAIPLSLAAIAADERRREITIDSGAEVWHLKASNPREFSEWARALERASRIARGLERLGSGDGDASAPVGGVGGSAGSQARLRVTTGVSNTQQDEDREWKQVESLVSRIVGTRDALRRLVKDMAAQQQQKTSSGHSSSYLTPATSTPTVSEDSDGYFTPQQERRPFWKRKASSSALSPLTPGAFQNAVSSSLAVPTPNTVTTVSSANGTKRLSKIPQHHEERTAHDHCAALLNDLDSVVVEFSSLLATSKRRRIPPPTSSVSRKSYESTSTANEEFFDAEAGDASQNQLMIIDHHSEDDTPASDAEEASIHESSSVSSIEDDEDYSHTADGTSRALFPVKPKSLTPLPITDEISRRKTIPPATVSPPSLIAFVRKNVGKDLSTISMPVSANEPLSLTQRVAEQLEYGHLLTTAAKQAQAKDRLLYVTAFAISQFSNGRAKERAIRKPFNPLLGETFELLRSDAEVPGGGFRLLVEKVCHRPVRLAMQADAASWSFAQSPAPTQKFWGKSAELTTEGRVRVTLRLADGTDEFYSWTIATMFLRNVVMGEKYVEPVGNMHVNNESDGSRAVVEFRSKGVFGGRGEEVSVELFGSDGGHSGLSLAGTWTGGLKALPSGREVWKVGELVKNAGQTYGLTSFAASLNEVTELERGKLPPTDSRLRPDQRFAEGGALEKAEEMKARLEERQRERRKEIEERGEEWKARWFVKVSGGGDNGDGEGGSGGGEEVWRLKGGKEGYWESRERSPKEGWAGVVDIFDVDD